MQLILNIRYFPKWQWFSTVPHPSILHSFFQWFQLVIELLLIFIHTFSIYRKGAKFKYSLIWILILLYFYSFDLTHIFLNNNFNIATLKNELSGLDFIAVKKLFLGCCWIGTIGHYKIIQNLIEIIHRQFNITRHLLAIRELETSLIYYKWAWKSEHYYNLS